MIKQVVVRSMAKPKRRRRFALPAQSKVLEIIQ
jgi:hypothetical protein